MCAVVIGLKGSAWDLARAVQKKRLPPVVFVHMPADRGMVVKVEEDMGMLEELGVPVVDIRVRRGASLLAWHSGSRPDRLSAYVRALRAQVDPRPITRTYFSDLDPLFSAKLSGEMHAALAAQGYLDKKGYLLGGWVGGRAGGVAQA